jgi:hypothetical protein
LLFVFCSVSVVPFLWVLFGFCYVGCEFALWLFVSVVVCLFSYSSCVFVSVVYCCYSVSLFLLDLVFLGILWVVVDCCEYEWRMFCVCRRESVGAEVVVGSGCWDRRCLTVLVAVWGGG